MLIPFIKAAVSGEHLDADASEEAMGIVMRGDATPAQIAGWLVALRQKGETTGEILGFARAMRQAMVALANVPEGAIDTCGTGGDGLSTFNISTAAALLVAACGVPVAKHGNRAVSSQSGSADVLAALGFDIDPGPEAVQRSLASSNFAFLFAPRFHPAMNHAAGPRREIGVRTVFNILGPLCNPARVRRQVVGVYDPARLLPLAEVLAALGAERAMVVCGPHGADELLPCGENRIVEWDSRTTREYRLQAHEVGLPECSLAELAGTDASANAKDITAVAAGQTGPKTDTALLNAGAALYVSGQVDSIADGIIAARRAVIDGRLHALLQTAGFKSISGSSAGRGAR
ncbi:MAG: anthranilate phosphoribosyltransferase [candidate division Zixibacteria bacterium]|nr:anthranilate phosphoribosyltransferase [candidate division Zixibacteria bacterium]